MAAGLNLIFVAIAVAYIASTDGQDIKKVCVPASWGSKVAPPYYYAKMEIPVGVRQGTLTIPNPPDCRILEGVEVLVCDDKPANVAMNYMTDVSIKRNGESLTTADVYATAYCVPYLGRRTNTGVALALIFKADL